ncbi:shikimate dehydrogenase [Acidothermaceae bacterium B102]|nr:shikimate dehydrogenase [Acidothermaceae bacterium B102]
MSFLSLITGSFSQPASDNPTGAMIEAAFRHAGLDARYLNCEVAPEGLADAVRGAKAMGWRGFNCSVPHKLAVIDLLDELTPAAAIIGAVNTVLIRDGRLLGENTDGKGFVESLRTRVEPTGRHVLIFGAGGAARAIAVETALAGAASVTIVNRAFARAEALAAHVAAHTPASAHAERWSEGYAVGAGVDVVVNATSIGMHPQHDVTLDLDPQCLRPGIVVADVIANPPVTALLRLAESRGCLTLTGLGMLVNQGVAALRLWTGLEPDAAVMQATLESALQVSAKN